MKVLVILGHQNTAETSFCHAIMQTVIDRLQQNGHEVVSHDLYAEQFDPVLTQEELDEETPTDPALCQHLDQLPGADGYVMIHPNWWGQPPAILKGWIDRVIRQGAIYRFGPDGVSSTIAGRRALVVTTSNTPRDAEIELYGDPLENLWKNCVFGLCGITEFVRRNFESVIMSTPEQRDGWLADTQSLVDQQFPAE